MHKEKSSYTIKYANLNDFSDEDSTDSEGSYSEDYYETVSNCNEKIDCTEQSNFDDTHFKQENDESPATLQRKIERESSIYGDSRILTPQSNSDVHHQVNNQNNNVESKYTSSPKQTQMLSVLTNENIKNKSTQSPRSTRPTQMLSVLTVVRTEAYTYPDSKTTSPTLNMREPRTALRKLEEELDNEHELQNFTKSNENVKEENNDDVIVNDMKLEGQIQKDEMVELIELDDNENHVEETEVEAVEHSKIKEETEDLTTDEDFGKQETQKENYKNPPDNDKSSKKKNRKCKKDKKKESQKSKHKRCEIM